jgi:Zn-dependent protease
MSEKPWEEFWIALAGPLVNVVIAGLLFGFLTMSGTVNQLVPLPPLGVAFLSHLMAINVMLVLFNLIPAFPMDGGRVLRALLAMRFGQIRATEIAVGLGMFLAVLMGVLGLVGVLPPMMVVIAVFVYFAGQQELASLYQRQSQRWWQGFDGHMRDDYPGQTAAPHANDSGVFLWDGKNGIWVRQKPLRPARSSYWE